MSEIREISTLEILTMLDQGLSRKEIIAKLELNPREAKLLFKHPAIKGAKKSKHAINIKIVEN